MACMCNVDVKQSNHDCEPRSVLIGCACIFCIPDTSISTRVHLKQEPSKQKPECVQRMPPSCLIAWQREPELCGATRFIGH